jgi:hypothetical protein
MPYPIPSIPRSKGLSSAIIYLTNLPPNRENHPCWSGVVSLLDMLRFYAEHYISLTRLMTIFSSISTPENKKERVLPHMYEAIYKPHLDDAEKNFNILGLGVCVRHVRDIAENIQKPPPSFNYERLEQEFFQLYRNLDREISSRIFYYIPQERSVYCDPTEPLFGLQVYERFKKAITDIEEAGKCLSFGRGTACVYHLMRVMELGLKSLGKGLDIQYAPSWESYLKQIESNITTKHPQKKRSWKKMEAFYRDAAGDLQMVKISWRNPTMHIVRSYTPEEAEDVFRSVRTFMQRLSEHFTDSGPIKVTRKKNSI